MPADNEALIHGRFRGLTPTPQSTHIEGASYLDNRVYTNVPRSELIVLFKPGKTQPAVRYCYFFDDAAAGEALYERLIAANHPWTQVGYPELVKGNVPYQRLEGGGAGQSPGDAARAGK